MEGRDQPCGFALQIFNASDARSIGASLARAFGDRFDEYGVSHLRHRRGSVFNDGEGRSRDALVTDDAFSDCLVQRHRHGQRIRECIRLVEQLAHRRDLRLTGTALQTFGNREHHMKAFAGGEALRQFLTAADPLDLPAETGERTVKRVNGFAGIELRGFLFRKS